MKYFSDLSFEKLILYIWQNMCWRWRVIWWPTPVSSSIVSGTWRRNKPAADERPWRSTTVRSWMTPGLPFLQKRKIRETCKNWFHFNGSKLNLSLMKLILLIKAVYFMKMNRMGWQVNSFCLANLYFQPNQTYY